MASLNRSAPKARPAALRATTLEMVRHACPDNAQAQRIGPPAMIELSTGMPAGAPPPAAASLTAVTNREGRGSQD
ncbi:hypothetical protein [Neorhizobium alkalisoli]|uniref:hypothetical protein n=1 Tax=Neorhizobium alkalisoli TaxID=528178 RepID=UPI000CF875C7|nr:hypothetical protein [Neorhizobium alkalisoli]